MQVSTEQIKIISQMQGLTLPEEDLENVALRLSTWLTAMEQIEAAMGPEINAAEPIPPVFPREEF
ncbi:MAG: hypothetical protein JWR68_2279 [Polaromonas sp.]|nr:hypothetical protein [Polaromonas sp.]